MDGRNRACYLGAQIRAVDSTQAADRYELRLPVLSVGPHGRDGLRRYAHRVHELVAHVVTERDETEDPAEHYGHGNQHDDHALAHRAPHRCFSFPPKNEVQTERLRSSARKLNRSVYSVNRSYVASTPTCGTSRACSASRSSTASAARKGKAA